MAKDKRRREIFVFQRFLTARGSGQSRLQFAPEQSVYPQGGVADAAFYVESGRVKISVVVPSGKEAVIAIRREGDFFGTRCLVGRRTGTVTALTASSLIRVTRSALIRLLREEPDFAVMFATHLVKQNMDDQENLVDYLTIRPKSAWRGRCCSSLVTLMGMMRISFPHQSVRLFLRI